MSFISLTNKLKKKLKTGTNPHHSGQIKSFNELSCFGFAALGLAGFNIDSGQHLTVTSSKLS